MPAKGFFMKKGAPKQRTSFQSDLTEVNIITARTRSQIQREDNTNIQSGTESEISELSNISDTSPLSDILSPLPPRLNNQNVSLAPVSYHGSSLRDAMGETSAEVNQSGENSSDSNAQTLTASAQYQHSLPTYGDTFDAGVQQSPPHNGNENHHDTTRPPSTSPILGSSANDSSPRRVATPVTSFASPHTDEKTALEQIKGTSQLGLQGEDSSGQIEVAEHAIALLRSTQQPHVLNDETTPTQSRIFISPQIRAMWGKPPSPHPGCGGTVSRTAGSQRQRVTIQDCEAY